MISLREAREVILQSVGVLGPRVVPLAEAHGCVLTEPVDAAHDVPPFVTSAMDGYAVRAVDTEGAGTATPVGLRVVGELPAGRAPSRAVAPGEAIRIMTGGVMPEGADAVVMVEETRRCGADGVEVLRPAGSGDHVRDAGGDVRAGQRVFDEGDTLSPAHVGVLAGLGWTSVSVYSRAVVGVLSTGDELVAGAGALRPGAIRDSNRPMLLAQVEAAGCRAVDLGIARDDPEAISAAIDGAASRCDALVTTGGVSVGDYDYVKSVLNSLGEMHWWQVAIKPAKPLAFGLVRGHPVFGLPGNPVSSNVSFELFVRPALLRMMGHDRIDRPVLTARAGAPLARRPDGKVHFHRVAVSANAGELVVVPSGHQDSNVLTAMAAANGLAVLPDGAGAAVGDRVAVMLLDAEPRLAGAEPSPAEALFIDLSHEGRPLGRVAREASTR